MMNFIIDIIVFINIIITIIFSFFVFAFADTTRLLFQCIGFIISQSVNLLQSVTYTIHIEVHIILYKAKREFLRPVDFFLRRPYSSTDDVAATD